jgi:hypothetical protein
VLVELSPSVYIALCGLVQEAMQVSSDATPLLQKVAGELAQATSGEVIPADFAEKPERMELLRKAGLAA